MKTVLRTLLLGAVIAGASIAALPQDVPCEVYTLPNGLTVILHEDHRLPQATVNLLYRVGSRDEAKGRTGFAHLFEHLMFMGTTRVPQGQFDQIMEGGGGYNNAGTGVDRTGYFSQGPSSLLPTLLWLDADRLEGLGKAMTQEKLDLQRDVVRNERRQGVENAPYGVAEVVIPESLYPEGHPYHHPIIGSHEDLEAAKLQDVKDFFATYYVPGNASLVVAGDFKRGEVKALVERTFGAVPASPVPSRPAVEPATLDREVRRMAVDRVQFPKLYLIWHSPRNNAPGDLEMSLLASILSYRGTGRLFNRLVLEERLAQEVDVSQYSKDLGSEFRVEVMAAEGADLEKIKRVVLEEMDRLKKEGPTEAELKRVQASFESMLLRRMENLGGLADMLNGYWDSYGEPDSFRRDLLRVNAVTASGITQWAGKVLGEGRLDFRILPRDGGAAPASLDQRPSDWPAQGAKIPAPEVLTLSSGVPLYLVSRPGTGLFSGTLLADGGERLVPENKAGLVGLAATMLVQGAGGKDAAAFADAVATLGGSVRSSGNWHEARLGVSGLSSRMEATLDLWADALLRPNLKVEDFEREKARALDRIRSRSEEAEEVAMLAVGVLTYGKADPRGRPADGYAATVNALGLEDVKGLIPKLFNPAGARLVFVGDFQPLALKASLEKRLAGWKGGEKAPALPEPLTKPAPGRIVFVDRPGAPQTVIALMRPAASPDDSQRALRKCLNTLFGGSFTSRLNQNLREKNGFTYGAGSSMEQDGNQSALVASTAVQTEVTGAALTELKKEFDLMARSGVTGEELEKAVRTVRFEIQTSSETTGSLSGTLAGLLSQGRPAESLQRELDALGKITIEGINGEARSGLFGWESLLVVLVGDKGAVLPQLQKAGFALPAFADVEGNLVK